VDRFITAERTWLEPTRWHVYVLPDLDTDPALQRLIERARGVMEQYPVLSVVEDAWLHATVQMVTGRAGEAVSAAERAALVTALQEQVGILPAFTVTAGSVLANGAGVVVDLDQDQPGEPWDVLSSAVRDAILTTFGPGSVDYDPGPPHVTLAYATGPEDSGVVQSQLRRTVRPNRAPMTVNAVWLLDVIQDVDRSQYRWLEPIARISLDGVSGGLVVR
jgi:hypothetical protein